MQDRHRYNSLESTHSEEKKELKEVRGMGEVGREVGEVEGGIMFYCCDNVLCFCLLLT